MRKIQTQRRTMTIQAVPEYSLAYVYDTNLKRYQARHFLRGEIPETINNKPVLTNMLPPGQYTIEWGGKWLGTTTDVVLTIGTVDDLLKWAPEITVHA